MNIEKRRSFIINAIYFLILAAAAFVLFKYALPLLAPFVLGFLVAYLLRRPICFLHEKVKLKKNLAAIVVVVLFYVLISGLLTLLGFRLVSGVRALVGMLPAFYSDRVVPMLRDGFHLIEQIMMQMDPELFDLIREWAVELASTLGNMVSGLSIGAVGTVSDIAAFLPGFFIKLLLMVISTFFIAADYDKLVGFCMGQLSERTKGLFLQIKEYLVGTLFVCIRSYALIMSITFVELAIGLTVIGVEYSLLIAAGTAVFDILPVLGTGGILIPWGIIALISGRLPLGVGLLLLYLLITVIRNIIEPKIVGGQLGLHPVVTLASMFAGVQLLGVVGLFGFPILLSLLRYLNDNGTISLFKTSGKTDDAA